MAGKFSLFSPHHHATMDVHTDAPSLLHYSPETEGDDVSDQFMRLYRRVRRRFCREVLKSPSVKSVWDAAMRPKWSPAKHNPVGFDDRLSKLISQSWNHVRPPVQQAAPYIEADPSLLDVHSGLAHTFGVLDGKSQPEQIALFNLRLWVTQGLHQFWDSRLTGETTVLFGVQTDSVQLKGLVPKLMLGALSSPHNLPDKGSDHHANGSRHQAPSHR